MATRAAGDGDRSPARRSLRVYGRRERGRARGRLRHSLWRNVGLAGRQTGKGGNVAAAALVGKRLAEKALAQGIQSVAFDRAGYRYHGRVKTLAEAAREAGLKF
jgi:hypothetical protein